jgi:hypothetical protein
MGLLDDFAEWQKRERSAWDASRSVMPEVRQQGAREIGQEWGGIAGLLGSLTKFQKAHQLAQKNAALPVEKGGLGLPPDNTAAQRAKAMGFNTPFFHGSNNPNITSFKATGSNTKADSAKQAIWGVADNPLVAETYANAKAGEAPTIYPMLARGSFLSRDARGATFGDPIADFQGGVSEMLQNAKDMKYGGIKVQRLNDIMDGDFYPNPDATHVAVFKPSQLRSVNAAFDPKKKNSGNILASMGLLGLLGSGMYGSDE